MADDICKLSWSTCSHYVIYYYYGFAFSSFNLEGETSGLRDNFLLIVVAGDGKVIHISNVHAVHAFEQFHSASVPITSSAPIALLLIEQLSVK